MVKTEDFVIDWYARPEDEVRYCATAHYAETLLTNSIYVLNCADASYALEKAEGYFQMFASQSLICKTITRIEILPKNAGRWSGFLPELVKNY